MGWFSGKYDDTNDASKSATIADAEWKRINSRAVKANPERSRAGSPERMKAAEHGQATYAKRWWN